MKHRMKHQKNSVAIGLLFLALAVASAASAQTPAPEAKAAPPVDSPTYIIGESDVLAINVWHEPELTRILSVRNDGKITMPLIGELQASGQTVEQLRATIATQLKHFLENPEVAVIIQEPRSQFFTIIGKVVKPGSYPLGQRLTVIDGIALGGGFKDFAKIGKIYVVRTHRDGTSERLPFDYKRAVGGDLTLNFSLETHDMIIVP
jgi:polysaccharide export outer membrane protein